MTWKDSIRANGRFWVSSDWACVTEAEKYITLRAIKILFINPPTVNGPKELPDSTPKKGLQLTDHGSATTEK